MNLPQSKVVLMPALRAIFEASWQQCRAIYFSAPCGVGKSTAAHALLEGRAVCVLSAAAPELPAGLTDETCDAVLIDDFQCVRAPAGQQAVCALLNQYPDKRFILLSRGVLPGWLIPYQLTGLLTTIDWRALLFDRDAVQELAAAYQIALTGREISDLLNETKGYPMLIALTCRRMAAGEPYSRGLLDESRRELFHYIEDAVYHRFSPPMRRLLLGLAPFDTFDEELAKLVSGDSHVNALLGEILHKTTMMQENGLNTYRFWPIFRKFLLWELEQACTLEEQNDIYRRAGLYYELHDDFAHALDCYTKSGDHSKMSELLVKNAELHPGAAHYYEMEQYYNALPREDILRSPTLICGMCMLASLTLDYDASEKWYAELQNYAARLRKTDANYIEAERRLLYLDIALSQRGSKDLAELVRTVSRSISEKNISLPEFSITSCLPSVLNGGKDFCEWTRQDELLYRTMRQPLETLLGRDGVGFVDCAVCESRFEKGEDVSPQLLGLMSFLTDIHRRGTPDIEFAVVGLMARQQVSQGRAQAALDTLDHLRGSFVDTGQRRFLDNLDAMRCRIWLRLGRTDDAGQWLRECAPSSVPCFRGLWRYRYMTKAMCLLADGDPDGALLTLAPMLPFCQRCERTLDQLHMRLLTAVCQYRKKDEAWKTELNAALDTAYDYGFITPVAQYGAAVLPLLGECGWDRSPPYWERLISAARKQAVNYPNFLRPAVRLEDPLSPAETQVLRLLCHDRSNQEIADTLGVKLPTVKTQVRSILQKLGVKRRTEAKEAAQRLHLIKE